MSEHTDSEGARMRENDPVEGRAATPVAVSDVSDPEQLEAAELAAVATTAPIEGGLRAYLHTYLQRLRGGELGAAPAVSALIALVIVFWALHPSFGSLGNFANLLDQAASTVFLAMGLVFVLLLGEIDLSAGTAAGTCAAIMARLSIGYNMPWPVAILAALVAGALIGLLVGWLCAKVRIPSFVVTLALFLGFQGVTLIVVNNFKGAHGNLSITDNFIAGLVNGQMDAWLGWVVVGIVIAAYAALKVAQATARARAGLIAEPISLVTLKVLVLAAISVVAVILLNENRSIGGGKSLVNINGKLQFVSAPKLLGVPWVVPLTLFFFALWTFVLTRTRYGRHVYAVGGNREAARRAGIAVDRIRVSVFLICSFMASIAGVLLASNVRAVDANTGGGNTLLLAVGAAVIGGTSLFGGKGRPLDAVVGGLVLAVIANGMSDLVKGTNGSAVQFIVTCGVLLFAAAIDALLRRRATTAGLG